MFRERDMIRNFSLKNCELESCDKIKLLIFQIISLVLTIGSSSCLTFETVHFKVIHYRIEMKSFKLNIIFLFGLVVYLSSIENFTKALKTEKKYDAKDTLKNVLPTYGEVSG